MTEGRLHAFTDDALADHDAVAIAALIRDGELSAREVAEAAIARAERVNPTLNAVVHEAYQQARSSAATPSYGALAGVPTFVKDNTPVAGMPTGHGTAAFRARPASKDGPFACQFLSAGFTVLGKSSLPEFGFNASTEFADGDPTRNPWHTGYSAGASSGGSAALVAAGVVPPRSSGTSAPACRSTSCWIGYAGTSRSRR